MEERAILKPQRTYTENICWHSQAASMRGVWAGNKRNGPGSIPDTFMIRWKKTKDDSPRPGPANGSACYRKMPAFKRLNMNTREDARSCAWKIHTKRRTIWKYESYTRWWVNSIAKSEAAGRNIVISKSITHQNTYYDLFFPPYNRFIPISHLFFYNFIGPIFRKYMYIWLTIIHS